MLQALTPRPSEALHEPETTGAPPGKKPCGRPAGINEKRRHCAVAEVYANMGSPDERLWQDRGGTVSEIRKALRLPAGADRGILLVLARIAEEGDNYDGNRCGGAGRLEKLVVARYYSVALQ